MEVYMCSKVHLDAEATRSGAENVHVAADVADHKHAEGEMLASPDAQKHPTASADDSDVRLIEN